MPLYSVATWDSDLQAYTPQIGVPAFNLTIHELRSRADQLRCAGNGCVPLCAAVAVVQLFSEAGISRRIIESVARNTP